MVSFLNIASLPTYLYPNYGRRLFWRCTLPKAVGSGFLPAIHRALGSCNTASPAPPFTTLSTFISPPQRVEWYLKGPLGAKTWKAETGGTYRWRFAHSLGFALVNPPLLHKGAVHQFYPAHQKRELNGPLTRPPKQEVGDSPCSHQRGTDL